MTQMTHLSHTLEKTVYAAKYDAAAKRLVADKQVLARIIKGTVKEFADYSIEEIIVGIEEEPEIATHEVYPGAIHGMNTESAIPGEGKVTYDVYFYVMTRERVPVKFLINIELQKEYYEKYHFGSRGVFYCARMLSEQLDTEFTADNYDDMKKVYSIWVCMEAPEKDANTITECSMFQNEVYGDFQGEERYDYLSVIIIRLSGKENSDPKNKLIDMLTILFSDRMDAETKKQELETKHGMQMSIETEGEIQGMCNLGEGLWDKAEAQGMEKGIEKGIVETCQDFGKSQEETLVKLMDKIQLNREEAKRTVELYWK